MSILVSGMLGIFSAFMLMVLNHYRTPSWITKRNIEYSWIFVSRLSFLFTSTLLCFGMIILKITSYDLNIFYGISCSVSMSVLLYVFFQSCYTDFNFRKVDRYTLYFATFLSFIPGVVLSITQHISVQYWVIISIFTFALIFIPIMGASDGRALWLCAISTGLLLPLELYFFSIFCFAFSAVIYAIIVLCKNKIKTGMWNNGSRKMYIPAVPFIVFPPIVLLTDGFHPWCSNFMKFFSI